MEEQIVTTDDDTVVLQEVTVQSLIATGAHYGHTMSTWNPKMAPYLYGTKTVPEVKRDRSGKSSRTPRTQKAIYIFDLEKTLEMWYRARAAIVATAARGGTVLFIGTKPQCQSLVRREALRSNSPFVDQKWTGGLLTNHDILRKNIDRLNKLETFLSKLDDKSYKFSKKERLLLQREVDQLSAKFGGVRNLVTLPDLVFIADASRNPIAIAEARRLGIPLVGITDSNMDPDLMDYPIPANDDASGALNLLISNVAEAVIEGSQIYQATVEEPTPDKDAPAQEVETRIKRK